MRSYNKSTGFRRTYHYEDKGYHLLGGCLVHGDKLLEILRLDYQIRLLAQREESLNHKARAWKKNKDIGNDMEQSPVADFDSKIRSDQAQRIKNEYTMFRLISELPSKVTRHLDSLRRDRLWYMRTEMVTDCAGRGGCCSRGCGCCARRSLSDNIRTRGHCTVECWCCVSSRDSSLTEEDQTSIVLDLDRLMENGKYVRMMANSYFRPLSLRYKLRRGVGNMKFGLKRMIK